MTPPPLRIACVIHSLDGGGAERVMAGLASRLADRGHAVTLWTLDDGTHSRHSLSPAVDHRPLDIMTTPAKRVSPFRRWRGLRSALSDDRCDVILSFCDSTNLWTLAATRGLGIPVVVSERSDPVRQTLSSIKTNLRSWLYRRAAAVVCLHDQTADVLRQTTGCVTRVIATAVDDVPPTITAIRQSFLSDPARADSPVRLIAIGRLEVEKGFDRLIAALSQLNASGDVPADRWTLTLLGDGSQRDALQHQLREGGLHDRVEMPGWVSPVWEPLASSDLFILPSRYEGFPSAMLESMAVGVASLVVDVGGGVRSAITHGCDGWIVDNTDDALRVGLARLVGDDSMRAALGVRATSVGERFGWDAVVTAYERVCREAADCGTMRARGGGQRGRHAVSQNQP